MPYASREAQKEYYAQYYQRHRVHLDAKNKKWRENHLERAHELEKKWRLSHPKEYRAHYQQQNRSEAGYKRKARWFARHPNAVNEYRMTLRDKLFEMYGSKCTYCGFSDKRALQLDHVNNDGAVPIINGKRKNRCETSWREALKEYRPDQFQILCANCNWIKRDEIYRARALKKNLGAHEPVTA